jgi:hypothetical protein
VSVSTNGIPTRHARRLTARFAAAVVATVGFALPAAGCGGSPGGHVARLGQTTTQSSSRPAPAAPAPQNAALAFARCMRSRGVPSWPDPDSSGGFPPSTKQIATANPGFQAARTACGALLPSGGPGPPTQAMLRQAWSDSRSFARCMRSHGVSSWPDPIGDPAHHPERPTFDLASVGIDQSSQQVETGIRACEPLLHGWTPYVTTAAGPTFLGGS